MRFCSLASGSSGNAVYIENEDTRLLVDAGLSGKKIKAALESIGVEGCDLDGILVTHEHSDHIKGVGILSRAFDLPVFATGGTWEAMSSCLGRIEEKNKVIVDEKIEFPGLTAEPIPISHDAAEPVGYSFFSARCQAALVTDTGWVNNHIRKSVEEADFFYFEANHDLDMLHKGRYPWYLKKRIAGDKGHLSNVTAGRSLAQLLGGNGGTVLLAHLSEENNVPDLARQTVAEILTAKGIDPEKDLNLEVAPRYKPSKLFEIL